MRTSFAVVAAVRECVAQVVAIVPRSAAMRPIAVDWRWRSAVTRPTSLDSAASIAFAGAPVAAIAGRVAGNKGALGGSCGCLWKSRGDGSQQCEINN